MLGVNISTAIARAVIDQLVAGGVRELVLAPGSRCAPLAFAAASAARSGRLRLHVRIDERSAAYLALGLAKLSRAPVAVVCTSGTAVANLLPAAVEASYSGIPLVLLTADRPPELRHVGANQTIDQGEIFGANVRFFADVTAPAGADLARHSDRAANDRAVNERQHTADAAVARACEAVAQALAAATAGNASGPVHINIGFVEPLVPDVSPDDASVWKFPALGPPKLSTQVDSLPIDMVLPAPLGPFDPPAASTSPLPARGVVVVGDVPSPDWSAQAIALAEACGWPILSEPSGNATGSRNAIAHFGLLLGSESFAAAHRPDFVITIGRFGISRPTLALVKSARRHVAVATAGRDRPDPLHTAAATLFQVPGPPRPNLETDPGWLASWQAAAARAEFVVANHSRRRGDVPALDGPELARLVIAACCSADLLLVAASRSVRDVQDYAPSTGTAPWIIGNRGASGIDGLISTAWGAALAHGGRTVALLGDLAFLHDTNGLLAPRSQQRPNLTVVVADNNGGGIFSSLEQGAPRFAGQFEVLFGTPHDLDLVAVARAHGARAVAVDTSEELRRQLAKPPPVDAVKVIVVKLPGRAREAAIRATLASQIRDALDTSVAVTRGRSDGTL